MSSDREHPIMERILPISVGEWTRSVTRWDAFAVLLVIGILIFLGEASRSLLAPLSELQATPLSLAPAHLPEYAARTTLRMLVALAFSLFFTFTYATLAAKSRRAELVLVPLLDILQSVPILGFLSITIVFFMSLAPGRVLGAEFAAIFAIFTSQAWNMAFSFYQSLRTVPVELLEAASVFRLSPWMRFWRIEAPFGMPQLIWNMMMSMSGSWFFVVASEAISVGNTTVLLPGMGSYIAVAIAQKSLAAVAWAIGTMLVVILIYDLVLFRPLVAWADRFRFEHEAGAAPPRSWVLNVLRRSGIVALLARPGAMILRQSFGWRSFRSAKAAPRPHERLGRTGDRLWTACVARGSGGGALAGFALRHAGARAGRYRGSICARPRDLAAYRDSHCDREPRLGARRSLGRNASARDAGRSTHCPVPRRISRQSSVSPRGLRHRRATDSIQTSGSAL